MSQDIIILASILVNDNYQWHTDEIAYLVSAMDGLISVVTRAIFIDGYYASRNIAK
jgi:hypothetical protein